MAPAEKSVGLRLLLGAAILGSAVPLREFFSYCLKMPLLPNLGTMDPDIPYFFVTWPFCLIYYRLTYHSAGSALNMFAPFWILTVADGDTACLLPILLTAPLLDWLI